MHPDDRPASIAEFKQELFYGIVAATDETLVLEMAAIRRLMSQFLAQRAPLILAAILLIVAILVTAFGPIHL